ncbi:Plant protein of unknown function (DUF869 [Striga hermonthica]|uniref:Filament-like plant protein 7 n=1 Tax=Striga hermonthica TaxID=68872 RepID=A0A9N7MIN5_STRHE|nr:Plant protein of unknown function (DUF869 [Striga hermonthica]
MAERAEGSSSRTISDEVQSIPNQKELDFENSLKSLNQKLASLLDECSAKDKIIQELEKWSENAAADKLEAENESQRVKHELDETRKQNMALNEQMANLNSALKDCMDQLNRAREQEFERARIMLEEKISETSKSLASQTSENSYLTKALLVKEKLIDDLNRAKCRKEAEFEALMTRLDSTEKENAFLRYEFRALESELEKQNEEMECIRRSAEARVKQNSENIKKVKKLEAECQRLRVSRRAGLLPGRADISLLGRIRDLENENRALKESLAQKEEEILYHFYAKNSDRLSLASSRSWADKFADDPENRPECRTIGAYYNNRPDMSLMDDFVEMEEKLAIVTVNDDWIRDVKNIISKQIDISKRNVEEIIKDIRNALESEARLGKKPELSPISGYIAWKSPAPSDEDHDHHPTVVDMFRKHLGGPGPGTAFELESVQILMHEMEKMRSVLQNEVMESKRTYEDEIEDLKIANLDLDTQLIVARSELEDVLRKLSSVEVELDNKCRFCEELEGTCVDLQLQLASVTNSRCSEGNGNPEEDLLQTGMEITKASVKLAECEQTIMKLGQQIKALGPQNEKSLLDKKKSTLKQRSSLRDQMICEDKLESDGQQSPKTKEIIISTTANRSVPPVGCYGAFPFTDGQVAASSYDALVVVPGKRNKLGFLKKLLLRRKKQYYAGKNKNNALVW